MVTLRRLRDDILVWVGIGLVAWAVAQFSLAVAVALIGSALVLDGLLGGRRR